MERLSKVAFHVGDRFRGPAKNKRRTKRKSLSAKRRRHWATIQYLAGNKSHAE